MDKDSLQTKFLLDVMLPLEMKNISIQILKTGRTKLNTGTHNIILLAFMMPALILFKWSYEVKLKLRKKVNFGLNDIYLIRVSKILQLVTFE